MAVFRSYLMKTYSQIANMSKFKEWAQA